MTRLGLKLFYLRTRERKLSQQAVAEALRIRQATISHLERGVFIPSSALLLDLCRFFDVTPTYLLDDERSVVPLATERWRLRNALVTVGMWVEADQDALVGLGGGKVLCPLLTGESFYDEDAKLAREKTRVAGSGAELRKLSSTRRSAEQSLQRALSSEMETHPRRRGRG